MGRARGRMSRGGLVGLERARDSAMVMSVEGRRSFSNELAGSINQFSLSSSKDTSQYFDKFATYRCKCPNAIKEDEIKTGKEKIWTFRVIR